MALNPVKVWAAGDLLTAADLNSERNNILNNALALISPLTGDLAFGGFRLTGLSAGSVASPGLQLTGDADTGLYSSGADTINLGTGGILRLTVNSVGLTVANGLIVTGSARLDANAVLTNSGAATVSLPTATDTLVGRATTDTLTNKTLTAPVIATIVNTGTLTLPTSTDTLVGRATTDTLTNKTLTTPTIASFANATHTHQDAAGGGQLSATSVFSAGTVPTARLGSGAASATTFLRGDQTWASGGSFQTEFVSSDQTVATSQVLPVPHSLGVKPKLVQVGLKCTTGELGFSVNDEVLIYGTIAEANVSSAGFEIIADAANVTLITSSTLPSVYRKDTGVVTGITAASWRFVVRAWK